MRTDTHLADFYTLALVVKMMLFRFVADAETVTDVLINDADWAVGLLFP